MINRGALWKFIRNECLYSKYYAIFPDFKAAISNCIATANTDKQKKLNSLFTLEFQTF
ncbi:Mobile element protein [Richelia intracellularis]|nr:Mobile element protein [Richelia intracellularis]